MTAQEPAPEPAEQCSILSCLDEAAGLRVFLHDLAAMPNAQVLRAGVGDLHVWAQRALLMARPGDIVCAPDPVDPDYLAWLGQIGVGPLAQDILALSGKQDEPLATRLARSTEAVRLLARRRADTIWLLPFIASAPVHRCARELDAALDAAVRVLGGPAELTMRATFKHLTRARAAAAGVPVAPGEVVELPCRPEDAHLLREAIRRQIGATGRVIIRGSRGASGTSTFLCGKCAATVEETVSAVLKRGDNRVYLVEQMLHATASPNVQFFVGPFDSSARLVSVSDQRLDARLNYQGNVWPCRAGLADRMIESGRLIAESLAGEGYRGFIGFDFVEYRRPGGARDYVLAELNPRVNAVAYPKALLEQLNRRRDGVPIPAFLSSGMETDAPSFSAWRERYSGRLFDPRTGLGVFPYTTGRLQEHRLSLVIFGCCRQDVVARQDGLPAGT